MSFVPGQVIAVSRRGRILLAAVREVEGDELLVTAEGGGQLEVAASDVLWTFAWTEPGETRKEIGQELRRRRLAYPDRADVPRAWESPGSDARSLGEWAEAAGRTADDAGVLAFLRGLDGELPYFGAEAGEVVRANAQEIDAERAVREADRREKEAEAALFDWFTAGVGASPDGSGDWLAEMRAFALGGPADATERAIRLARRIGCPESDDLLERFEDTGLLPLHIDVGPRRHGVPVEFSEEVVAARSEPVPPEGREDLTGLFTVAIDDPATFEVDDALSWEIGAQTDRLWIHIADVAAAIPLGSPLDVEARRRALTIYQPDRTIPMFPPSVAVALSLAEGEVRPAITAALTLSKGGEVLEATLARTLVRVDRRAGYDEPAVLGESPAIAEALRATRLADGAIALDLPEAKPAFDDKGRPYLKVRSPVGPADLLVSEAAVLFNRMVADRVAEEGIPAVFRHQERCPGPLPGPDDPLQILIARRMLPPAETSAEPRRHHGVAADRYLMATSPIRRYVDLVHHRQLGAWLDDAPPPYDRAAIDALVEELAARERAARFVQSERTGYWLARLIETRTGATLDGLVSRVLANGRIGVWIPDLMRELTLRLPREWPRVRERDPIRARVERVRPRRGSVRLSVVPD